MDDMVKTEELERLPFNLTGFKCRPRPAMSRTNTGNTVKHVSAMDPANTSWVLPCSDNNNGSTTCQTSRSHGCSYSTPLIAAVTVSLSAVTVLGNFLVMLSIRVNRQLQTVNNYFLFSLACADLAIGLLSMNLYGLYVALGYWPLGAVACDLWLALDYAVGNASVLHLLLIGFDRYFCLTRPLSYPARRTARLARLMVAAAWALSFLLWAPTILLWQSLSGAERIVPDGECYVQLLSSPAVTLATTLPSFYLPAAVMVALYTAISLTSRRRVAEMRWGTAERERTPVGTSSGAREENGVLTMRRRKRRRCGSNAGEEPELEKSDGTERRRRDDTGDASSGAKRQQRAGSLHPEDEAPPQSCSEQADTLTPSSEIPSPDDTRLPPPPAETTDTDPGWPNRPTALLQHNGSDCSDVTEVTQNGSPTLACPSQEALHPSPGYSDGQARRRRRAIAREKRVTRIILAILLAFMVTWTPYNVMAVVGAFCHVRVPEAAWAAGYWLCYVNSTINPACYALCNAAFRKTFRKLLRCRCSRNLERK